MLPGIRVLILALAILSAACADNNPAGNDAGDPVKLVLLHGAQQHGVMGELAPERPSVLVVDANNRGVPGVTVQFEVVQGTGQLSSTQARTDATGEASVAWTLGMQFGLQAARAFSDELDSVLFVATAVAPNAGIAAFSASDPANDTLPNFDSDPAPAIDLVSMAGRLKRDSLIITLTFSRQVSAAATEQLNSVGGAIEIDIDDNGATGDFSVSDFFGASSGLGVEYGVSLFSLEPDKAIVFRLEDEMQYPVPMSFAGNVVTIRIPMAILDYDASFSLVGIFGTLDRPTDYAPNTGKVTVGLGAGSVATEPVTSAPRAASAAARREGWASLRIRTP